MEFAVYVALALGCDSRRTKFGEISKWQLRRTCERKSNYFSEESSTKCNQGKPVHMRCSLRGRYVQPLPAIAGSAKSN